MFFENEEKSKFMIMDLSGSGSVKSIYQREWVILLNGNNDR